MSLVKAIVVIGTSAIALVVLAWLAVPQTNEAQQMAPSRKIGPSNTVRATDEPMSPMTYISMDALPRISSALRNALRNGKITVNELEKLDFTNLDSLDFDKATSYKVLNPKSPRAIFSKAKPLIPQSILDLITIQKGSKPVINMRRVIRQDGATIDRLVMILSDVRPDMCVNPVNGTSNEGGSGANTYIFTLDTAFDGIDTITDFDEGDGDVLDISDIIAGNYDPLVHALTDFVEITTSGTSSIVKVDHDGTGTAFSMTQIATLNGVTGLTDEAALAASGNLIVS